MPTKSVLPTPRFTPKHLRNLRKGQFSGLKIGGAGLHIGQLASDLAYAQTLAEADRAPSTRAAYAVDFGIFTAWCRELGISSLPASPEAVAAFIAAQARLGKRAATIGRRLAAIRYAHQAAAQTNPCADHRVRSVINGLRRTQRRGAKRKRPLKPADLVGMLPKSETLAACRDRALLLVGFAGAFRRSELVALDVEDITESNRGILVCIGKSKTDQDGKGQCIAIPRTEGHCPVAALKSWLQASGITEGPIFRPIARSGAIRSRRLSAHSAASIVKAYANTIGLNGADYSGHSLRSGFLTAAAGKGASVFKLMDQSRHKSLDTLATYVRDAEIFDNHAGASLI